MKPVLIIAIIGENILHIEEVKSIPELKEPKVEIIYDE